MKYPVWLPPLLGFLTAVGPVSTDMYLPAFPSIEASFGSAAGTAQITLATWFLGLSVGQMTQGTLSDRYGRKWPLLIGTGIYTVASAGCALAPDLWTLSLWRAIAAFGGSASMVIPRAVVRDLADGHAAARVMSQLLLVMGVAPILAPTLGGAVLGFADWHAIFWIACIYGVVCIALVASVLPDTLPEQRRVKLGLAGLIARYAQIGKERSFLTHAAVGGFSMFGVFAYLGGSPGVYIGMYHVDPEHYGMMFGACAAGYILFSQVNARILPRFGLNRLLRFGSRMYLVATVLLTIAAFTGWGGLWGVFLPIGLMMASNGFLGPNAAVGALSRHAAHAGSASALMGTGQFLMGALSGLLVGVLDDGTARPMALLILIGGLGAVISDQKRPRV
jgi:MFS transporter, DHA1 family, multidrug resistance protein